MRLDYLARGDARSTFKRIDILRETQTQQSLV
jgi:hypothetical protein